MKKMSILTSCLLVLVYSGCKSKTEKKEGFFPVLSFIKSQVAHVDTSLFRITKLVRSGNDWDTSFIKREEFKTYAADFLELPDLSESSIGAGYEESKFFDASLNRAIITYLPKDKSSAVQREELTIEPGVGVADQVKNIIVDKQVASQDSSLITKRLLWIVDESFQVTTIIQRPGIPDSTQTTKIIWE